MDVDNSFLEQQVRSTAAKRSSNSLNDCDGNGHSFSKKKPKQERDLGFAVPDRGCFAPVPLRTAPPPLTYNDHQEGHVGVGNNNMNNNNKDNQVAGVPVVRGCKQFWKAGDYEGGSVADSSADHSGGSIVHATLTNLWLSFACFVCNICQHVILVVLLFVIAT